MRVFKNRSFTFIWIGNATSELGGAFGTFCNSLLVYELTGSTMALGSMWLLYFLPSLVLQLVIGPYIDKWSRKWVMIIALWSRGLIFVLPLLAHLGDVLVPWHIYVVQLLIGLITPIYVPANQAILPTIVPQKQLIQANAYVDGTVRLMTFMAPVTAGIVIEYIGISTTLFLICFLLVTSGFLVLFVNERREKSTIRKRWVDEFNEGIRYFFKQRTIVWLGFFLAFVQFGVGVTMVINLPYVTDILGENYAMYGYFMAGFPLGYVVGTLLVGKILVSSRRLMMLGALVIGGLTYINLGITHSIDFAIITETIAGVVIAFFNVHNTTLCQQTVPNHLMGKVFSVRLLIIRGMMPLGILVGGLFSEWWGIRPLYILIGTIICLVSFIGILLPYFKFMDHPVKTQKTVS
ncbi:Predicted arabinose efflux permease, MFS family [Oceanobacillus limi]|uniref:Predicted arabinose efflux permease, MFS family n=1 Tax=Oceanobacillus limi TaxID=930131 RepID=A0A1I0F6Z0_9BACI|nr:MFS transporter [Oceanobacillus limi]SET53610.1 Predicted arabinose efflux permease, MFS family [Oceanobacillus limi]